MASAIPSPGRTRLAPTPSGMLHTGNAFNFLVTAGLARRSGSQLILRIDDLDNARVRREYVEDIFRTLEWLGIRPDDGPSGPDDLRNKWSQVHRSADHRSMIEQLRALGVLYSCSCSRAQMAARSEGEEHSCRERSFTGTEPGIPLRLRIDRPCPVSWLELNGHLITCDLSELMEDPILRTKDGGQAAYQVASLVDDAHMGITFVVRGRDLFASTACQMHLADLLQLEGFQRVQFHHHPLQLDENGNKLSKSDGVYSLAAMRAAGASPQVLIDHAERYIEALIMDQ